ncbi:MAG: leucyl/phenylalanyl-tRNA--protein transferase [Deltaproteobacteria bacterium]|nr:leucyl/phenylalanyl-tRNA--protein transferase [Deltaproteobacteria bacterium]MBN2674766.1 leucyl/phenylalanyl-tRNA--protein transferase [Deltaproteobacteria bacterium]
MPQPIDHPEEFGLPEDLVAIGGELDTETLLDAYKSGVFPWPEDDDLPMLWFFPNPRGILRHDNLHISRSLRRTLNKNIFEIQIDTVFDQVIEHCRTAPRPGQAGTWITSAMKQAYKRLHREGFAHSVEAFHEGKLVGGVYGVYVNNTFSGESMFHTMPDASKAALVALVRTLHRAGVHWIDTQMTTPVVEALGGELISKNEYLDMLENNRKHSVISWSAVKNSL